LGSDFGMTSESLFQPRNFLGISMDNNFEYEEPLAQTDRSFLALFNQWS
jgi:hypothetical protein